MAWASWSMCERATPSTGGIGSEVSATMNSSICPTGSRGVGWRSFIPESDVRFCVWIMTRQPVFRVAGRFSDPVDSGGFPEFVRVGRTMRRRGRAQRCSIQGRPLRRRQGFTLGSRGRTSRENNCTKPCTIGYWTPKDRVAAVRRLVQEPSSKFRLPGRIVTEPTPGSVSLTDSTPADSSTTSATAADAGAPLPCRATNPFHGWLNPVRTTIRALLRKTGQTDLFE